MGWKGKGLGKEEQGTIAPLIFKKTDVGSGIIDYSKIEKKYVL